MNKHCKSCDFGWTDFSPYDFQAFQQDGDIGLHECAYIDTYDSRHWWQDNSCYTQYRFICELVPDGSGAELPNYEQPPGKFFPPKKNYKTYQADVIPVGGNTMVHVTDHLAPI